jgi:3,4-dihydroxy 2-butanone 4-phosphate synthase/GTP cyclohydrolase II
MPFAPIDDALDAIRRGEVVVVVDDDDHENEGTLVAAAATMTPDRMAFVLGHANGVVCQALHGERLDELDIDLLNDNVPHHELPRTAFAASVDYAPATTRVHAQAASGGAAAAERASTVRALVDASATATDFLRPGHVFLVRARPGGVLQRAGHAEASVDLAGLAGRFPSGVLAEVVNDDGTPVRLLPQLGAFAAAHGLLLVSIADLVRYRRQRETLVRAVATARIPTEHGEFAAHVFASDVDATEHVAFVKGDVAAGGPVLVRVHSECLTGDVFGSLRCDCGPQLQLALAAVAAEGRGVVVYLRGHEGRGIGLGHKLRAYALQDRGRDTVEANLELGFPVDSREYGIGAQILVELGVTTMRLMTNNLEKHRGLEAYGLEVVERVPLQPAPNVENLAYLRTKQHKLGHLLDLDLDIDLHDADSGG